MKLTQKAIKAIRKKALFPHLAIALNVSVGSIYRYVATNDDNLTKVAAVEVIKKETGMTEDEILEKQGVSIS
jgi:hypothetical protein